MTASIRRLAAASTLAAGATAAVYVGLVTGACPLDLGVGRRERPLGPQHLEVAAPRDVVFDLIAEPYLGRAPRALTEKIRVLERAAATWSWPPTSPRLGGLGLVAQTVETVCFTRPERVDFRLVRGPVPHVVEAFVLSEPVPPAPCSSTKASFRRPVGGGPVVERAGGRPAGAVGRGLAGGGQGRSRAAGSRHRGLPASR